MKIGTFGMLNNPEYRQEPWRESFAQKLMCFDQVAVVCGHEPDLKMLADAFPRETEEGRLVAVYKPWPFPDWSYEELPRHLNTALNLARELGWDWGVRLDVDTVLHEKDRLDIRTELAHAQARGKWIVSLEKLQFFNPRAGYQKGKMPLAIKMDAPIAYGMDSTRYTDLCQPIVWDKTTLTFLNGVKYDIPFGPRPESNVIYECPRIRLFNYDYTFRTYDRARELLYRIELAHARFWKQGYTGKTIEDITKDSSMNDFLGLSAGRARRMILKFRTHDHPVHFITSLENLTYEQWGHSLWGKVVVM